MYLYLYIFFSVGTSTYNMFRSKISNACSDSTRVLAIISSFHCHMKFAGNLVGLVTDS